MHNAKTMTSKLPNVNKPIQPPNDPKIASQPPTANIGLRVKTTTAFMVKLLATWETPQGQAEPTRFAPPGQLAHDYKRRSKNPLIFPLCRAVRPSLAAQFMLCRSNIRLLRHF